MRDIAAVMVTVDRSPSPNYLAETLANMKRGGLTESPRLRLYQEHFGLRIYDSSGSPSWAAEAFDSAGLAESPKDRTGIMMLPVFCKPGGRCANLNVSEALFEGSQSGAPWVLFLEDDIDVCADFFDSVGAWLDDHAQPWYPFYPLGASYPQVERAQSFGASAWEYPIDKFYGTQAVAFPAHHAAAAAAYLAEHCYDRTEDGTCYDLLLADYARGLGGVEYLLTPAPSLVQHKGRTSVIRPRPSTHTFDSWPGREWSYLENRRAA